MSFIFTSSKKVLKKFDCNLSWKCMNKAIISNVMFLSNIWKGMEGLDN